MDNVKLAMAAVDKSDADEAQVTARAQQLAAHRKHLPSIRKDALVRTFEKEIDGLRLEILERQAKTQARLEAIDDDEEVASTMVTAANHEAEQARSEEMRRFDKQIEALRYDLKIERRKAAEKRKVLLDAAEGEQSSAENMLGMLLRALGEQA